MDEGKTEVKLRHKDFTEIVRKVDITEEAYQPSRKKNETLTTTYYAHIGMMEDKDKEECTYFANWDGFLREYFLTAGKANEKLVAGTVETVSNGRANTEKLIESFRNYAPTLYKVLTDEDSAVKAVQDFKVGEDTLSVMAIKSSAQEKNEVKDLLIQACVRICKEVNATNHLSVWRRYLQTVWLHN